MARFFSTIAFSAVVSVILLANLLSTGNAIDSGHDTLAAHQVAGGDGTGAGVGGDNGGDGDGPDNPGANGGGDLGLGGNGSGTGLDGGTDPNLNNTGPGLNNTSTTMTKPPINADQLAGLVVAGVFLIIFLPGFFCLWNIQTPQTFTTLDSDLSKKNQ